MHIKFYFIAPSSVSVSSRLAAASIFVVYSVGIVCFCTTKYKQKLIYTPGYSLSSYPDCDIFCLSLFIFGQVGQVGIP